MTKKKLSLEIERLYYLHARGLQINIMDIGKVFGAGEAAAKAGQPIEPAVIAAIKVYCKVAA